MSRFSFVLSILMECGVVMSHIVCQGRSKVSWNKKDMWSESLHIPRIPKDLKDELGHVGQPPILLDGHSNLALQCRRKETLLLSAITAT